MRTTGTEEDGLPDISLADEMGGMSLADEMGGDGGSGGLSLVDELSAAPAPDVEHHHHHHHHHHAPAPEEEYVLTPSCFQPSFLLLDCNSSMVDGV